MRFFLTIAVFLTVGVSSVLAQVTSNDFTISLIGPSDTTPPSTPTLLSATPITSTQITLTWSSSTDDTIVSGYSVLRGGVPIATTTLLNYADTGLTASTTYLYAVRAFDGARNYSTTSNSIATTTLAAPVTPPPPVEGPREGTAVRVVLRSFAVETGLSTARLLADTARPARLEVRWGRTASYELGYVVSNVFTKEHEVLLTDLEPGTTYEYEVVGYLPRGQETLLRQGTFVTAEEKVEQSPANVHRFRAAAEGNDVLLDWELPRATDVQFVRIVRSHLGFPEHPQDGAIVYQGAGTTFRDVGVLAQYSPLYYTAFVYDTSGNVSSGAVAVVFDSQAARSSDSSAGSGTTRPSAPTDIGGTLTAIEGPTSSTQQERLTVDMRMPELSDITITQAANEFTLIDQEILLDPQQPFTIVVPRRAVAGNLKSIIITIVDPTDNRSRYSYLLRINKDRSAYEAQVPGVGVAGESQLALEIYDYEAYVVATYQAPLTFSGIKGVGGEAVVFPDVIYERAPQWLRWSLLPLLIFLIIFFWYRRRTEDNV